MDEGEAAVSPHGSAPPGYSDAFNKLITGSDDIEGMLAYVLYKREKRAFIINNNLSGSDERVKKYHDDLHGDRIDSLKARANLMLKTFSNHVVNSITDDEIQRAVETALYKQIKADIKSGTRLWKAIVAGVAASFVFALVLTAARLIDWSNPLHALGRPPVNVSNTVGANTAG